MSSAKSLPFYARATYHHESKYALLRGMSTGLLLFLTPLVAEYALAASRWHLALLASAFPVGMLLAPMWAQLGRRVGMKRIVIWPAVLVALILSSLALVESITPFVVLVCAALVLMAPTLVGETSLYKTNYPDSHRNRAVGLVRALGNVGSVLATLTAASLMWVYDRSHVILFPLAGAAAMWGLWYYGRIRVRSQHEYWRHSPDHGSRLGLREALRVLAGDRRFLLYELGFALSGLGNFVSYFLVVKVLNQDMGASKFIAMLVIAVAPTCMRAVGSRLWGPVLDRLTPVSSHMIFVTLSTVAYGAYLLGCLTLTLWPFFIGAVVRGTSLGGSSINWSTGSMYFAPPEKVNTYAGIHIGLTGLRGTVGPLVGALVFGWVGTWVFGVSVGLCAASFLVMLRLLLTRRVGVTRIVPAMSASGRRAS